jgi:hypothetical protein
VRFPGSHGGEYKDYILLCGFVGVDRRFRGAYRGAIHHPDDGSSTHL